MKPLTGGLLFSLLMVHIYLVKGKEVVCGFPGTPAYGYVKPDMAAYKEGDVVTYTCRIGYILLGSPVSRCTDDGSWSEEVPICDDSMTTLGVAFSTPTVPGHSAEMAIDRDKETCTYLKPKKPRWWRIDLGNKHKVLSVAVTMISADKNVKFAIYVIETQDLTASYKRCASFSGKFGTHTIVLSCEEGKGIVGERVHIEDTLQTDELFEICEVEVQVEKDTGYDCGRPSRNLYSITLEPRGGKVKYGCIRGYEIKGKDYRTCLSSGQWSDEPPICEPIRCDDLEPLENGETKFQYTNNIDQDLAFGNEETLLEGAIAIFKCNEGYKLIGSFTRNCLKDGSWSGSPPQCKAIRCPIPDGKDLGGVYRLVNKTNSMGSMAMLRCKRGKREGDNPYITCTEDGQWTEPEAYCIIPVGASYERTEEPRIVNRGAVIFGMIVAAVMIVVVLVALYLYNQKRNEGKPQLPSRVQEPLVPPPRPPPRAKAGGFKTALMGFMNRENAAAEKADDKIELKNSWKTQSLPSEHAFSNDVEDNHGPKRTMSYGETLPNKQDEDKPAVIEVEVLAQDESRRKTVPTVPEENEDVSLENVVIDVEEKGSEKGSAPKEQSGGDYAAVDYEKKRQSRLLKEQDSMESSSTAAASPLPPDEIDKNEESRSPTPPKRISHTESEEESEEEESSAKEVKDDEQEAEEQRKKEEEEKKAKEEEERKAKEEEERKAKEEEERKAKEEEERKAEEAKKNKPRERKPVEPATRRRQRTEDPPPAEEDKPVLRRFRRFQ